MLLRERDGRSFEVLLVKRHEKSGFMGGLFVYPGGVVESQDGSMDMLSLCRPGPTGIPGIDEKEDLSSRAACLRELFEEVALLLAIDRNGAEPALNDPVLRDRFAQYRTLVLSKQMSLARILEEEQFSLATDRIYCYARWITPEARPVRFDTYFFVGLCPPGQDPMPDGREITEARWMTPEDALDANMRGHLALSPPTFRTLEEISGYESTRALFAGLGQRDLTPVLPLLVGKVDSFFIIFPWDGDYESCRRGERNPVENPGEPCLPGQGTTRLLVREGRPLPYRNP